MSAVQRPALRYHGGKWRLAPWIIAQMPEHRFVVYGLKRHDQKSKGSPVAKTFPNCIVRDFSEDGFVADLATARAVVCNGGLSLIGEALYLGKPIFSVPA